jgi:hypothetical protein
MCLESEGGVKFHVQFMSQIDLFLSHHTSLAHAVSAGINVPAFHPVHIPMTYTPPSASLVAASAAALEHAVNKTRGVAFIASNCGWWRDVIVAGVMQHVEVSSLGACLRNAAGVPPASYSLPGSAKTQVQLNRSPASPPPPCTWFTIFARPWHNSSSSSASKMRAHWIMSPKSSGSLYSQVKVLRCSRAIFKPRSVSGCVPIYVGAHNIDDIAPRGSFINANNMTSTEIAAQITKYLADSSLCVSFR